MGNSNVSDKFDFICGENPRVLQQKSDGLVVQGNSIGLLPGGKKNLMEFLLQAWKVKSSDRDKAAWYFGFFCQRSNFYRTGGQGQKAAMGPLTNAM